MRICITFLKNHFNMFAGNAKRWQTNENGRRLSYIVKAGNVRAVDQAVSCRIPTAAGPVSNPGQAVWDLWWTKRYWCRFSPSTATTPATHRTDCSTFISLYEQAHHAK
jgi:hypothetical protein